MDTKELKVLLIEDNAGDAFLIKFYLGESVNPRFNFFHAENMKTANELLASNSFDIILMDLNLPDSVGLDTIKKLLEKYPTNLVIVLTGLVDEKVGLETVRYGAQDFLVKGKFDGKVLISSIMFAFERFNLNKELSSVSSELNKGEERFSNIQMLFNSGYIEVDISKKLIYQSPHLLKLLNLSPDKEYQTIEETMAYIVDVARIIEDARASFATSTVNEVTFAHKSYTAGDLKVRWIKVDDTKIIGTVFPA
ncbi:MAG: response regulator receiver protein [Bacteroidetes bacterium]|nr:response regulator receiver protein [Bacteroidota bacterium]